MKTRFTTSPFWNIRITSEVRHVIPLVTHSCNDINWFQLVKSKVTHWQGERTPLLSDNKLRDSFLQTDQQSPISCETMSTSIWCRRAAALLLCEAHCQLHDFRSHVNVFERQVGGGEGNQVSVHCVGQWSTSDSVVSYRRQYFVAENFYSIWTPNTDFKRLDWFFSSATNY